MENIIFVCVILFIVLYQYQKYKYRKLYNVSATLLQKHYTEIIIEELECLKKFQGKEDYQEIFQARTRYLKDKLKNLPKNIKEYAWNDAVSMFDSKQPRAICKEGVWGRGLWYNSIKETINVQ